MIDNELARLDREMAARRELPAPSVPLDAARVLVERRYTTPAGAVTLRHWRSGWWEWRTTHWAEIEPRAVRAAAYEFTEHAVYRAGDVEKPWAPTSKKIGDILDALAAAVHLPESTPSPSWLDGRQTGVLVACANGLLDVGARTLLPHDPLFFNGTSVPFGYDPAASAPQRWHRFLGELWGDDASSIAALAQWFGYVVSGRLDMQKIMLLVGPTRAGKGVIARTLGALVGNENVAGPTLSSLNGDFGLAPLLGKTLAVVSDARLNGRGGHTVVERLLSISGEDPLTVNRKYRDQWTGKLPSRLMLCSNELPQLGDASMAIAGRFVPLLLERSWYGKEDLGLEPALREEMTGILNWALAGLERLERQGEFTRPPGADDTIRTLQDLASPVAAFARDRCVSGPDQLVAVDELYKAFRDWADDNGHVKSTKQVFGRDLRAAVAGRLKIERPRDGDERMRVYAGISLRP